MAAVPKIDEFAFILLGGVLMIFLLTILWTTPTEAPPLFEPKSIELLIKQGSSESFDIKFDGIFTGINLTEMGDIRGWVTFNKQNFDAFDEATVRVTVKVPDNKNAGHYNGRIEIQSAGGRVYMTVSVEVLEQTEEVAIERLLGPLDFTVSYSKGVDVLDSKSSVIVSKGYFSGSGLDLKGIMTSSRLAIVKDAFIQLEIDETNGAGNLLVTVNDETVYDDVVNFGTLTIPVDKDLLGTSNVVKISAGSPGWKFWMSTVYNLQSSSFGINYEGIFSKSFEFELASEQVTNFKSLNLNYMVKDYSLPLPELMIKVNNQIVFWERPPLLLSDQVFTKGMFDNDLYLIEGNNTIEFSFDRDASYSVANAILTVKYYS